jgi:hypothetical protein
VRSASLFDRVLLAGDGWWAEPDIGEWLWVGDYVWQPGDRLGRLSLVMSSDIGGARWVVVGDNTPFINSQLVADPRPAIRILEMATLWPAFLNDLFLLVLCCFLLSRFPSKWHPWVPLIPVTSLALVALLAVLSSARASTAWRDAFVGESAFDERNFNLALTENPELVNARRLIRKRLPVSGVVSLPEGNSVIFMLVNGSAEIGEVKLSQCHRMGSLQTAEGPYLMDAQACQLEGPARVLIGSPESAAAFTISEGGSTATVLLDVGFLGQKAPSDNMKWLLKEIGSRRAF